MSLVRNARTIVRLAGYTGVAMLLVTAALLVYPRVRGLIGWVEWIPWDPESAGWILTADTLVTAWLLLINGYKRLPFWVNLVCGTAMMIMAVFPAEPGWIDNDGVLIAAGIYFFLTARYVSHTPLVRRRRFTFLVPAFLIASTAAAAYLLPDAEQVVYAGELDAILAEIDPAFRNLKGIEDEVEQYAKEIAEEHEENPEEQRRLIEELNRRIAAMEDEMARFEAVKERNGEYREELTRLSRRLEELEYDREAAAEIEKVGTYDEAVRPSSPRVRDFAVKLASDHPGSYYRHPGTDLDPSREGIRQILTIHRYVAGKWKYVNDPLFEQGDYYSPADRTIALGLAGDCDDFAVLLASCVEAIGGRARIVHGSCSQGGHAWCEVFVGAAWSDAVTETRRMYPGRSVSYLTPRGHSDYWLCLDWQAGVYSCGDNPRVVYESHR